MNYAFATALTYTAICGVLVFLPEYRKQFSFIALGAIANDLVVGLNGLKMPSILACTEPSTTHICFDGTVRTPWLADIIPINLGIGHGYMSIGDCLLVIGGIWFAIRFWRRVLL